MDIEFDDNNPWHTNAHLVFGFQCIDCDSELGSDDVKDADLDKDFLGYCVKVSTLAQQQGWTIIDTFSYKCPKCSK